MRNNKNLKIKYPKKNLIKSGKNNKNLPIMKNILNTDLKKCSILPLTGFYRDGYCRTGAEDKGTHSVCAKMNKKFLDYSKKKGNNLYTVVKPGQKWCLCEYRWYQAYKDNIVPKVILKSTNKRTNYNIQKKILHSLITNSLA